MLKRKCKNWIYDHDEVVNGFIEMRDKDGARALLPINTLRYSNKATITKKDVITQQKLKDQISLLGKILKSF